MFNFAAQYFISYKVKKCSFPWQENNITEQLLVNEKSLVYKFTLLDYFIVLVTWGSRL